MQERVAMKLISSGAERMLTSDALADEVLEYAGVLARAGTADTITIPIVADSGSEAEASLLLGPASQLSLLPPDARAATAPILRGEARALDELRHRRLALEPEPLAAEPDDERAFIDFDRPTA